MTTNEQQVKRFVAPTMTRALEMVRDDMGPEAVILSSKKVKGGVEVLISSEPDLPTRGIPERRAFGQNFDTDFDRALDSDMSWQTQAGIERAAAQYNGSNKHSESAHIIKDEGLSEVIERAREKMFEAKRQALAASEQAETMADSASQFQSQPQSKFQGKTKKSPGHSYSSKPIVSQPSDYRADVTSISEAEEDGERKLESLRGELADLRMLLEEQVWSRDAHAGQRAHQIESGQKRDRALTKHLARLGLAPTLIEELCQSTGAHLRISEAWQTALSALTKKISVANNMDTGEGGVFAFIGPTGVGKTTSLAKLASRFTIANGPGKVALVSMDTHRVGSIEQLRALGRILDAPVRAVGRGNSLMTTLASLRQFPLVLIDTAGFRHGDPQLQRQLQQLDENDSVRRMLVLSSLSQVQTLKASIHAYQPRMGIDACIISKLDEATSIGESISAVTQHDLPVAYVTDGQEIPRHIRAANAHDIVASAVSIAKRATSQAEVLS